MTEAYSPERRRLEWLYGLLGLYNGLVVLLMAGFMSLTQEKIITTMSAHAFLTTLPIVPLPAFKGFWLRWALMRCCCCWGNYIGTVV